MFELTKEDFFIMRKDGLTFKEIGEFYNLSEYQVHYRTKKWGLDFSKKKRVNELFFSGKTKASYYWAGFIAADGSIEEDRHRLSIGIGIKDIGHLEKFKLAVESSHDICKFMGGAGCRIRFSSPSIIKDLKNTFNITKNKTYNYVLPNIEEDYLFLEFMRGFIDGDGHYELKASGRLSLQIAAWDSKVLEDITSRFSKLLCRPILQKPNLQINKKGTCYSIVYNLKDSEELIRLLYKNSTESTRLTRKYNTIKKIMV